MPGLTLTQFSAVLTPTISSASTARPMWAPTLWTPGMACNSRPIWVVLRTISGRDVPGLVTQWTRKSSSLKSGNSDCPRNGSAARPASTMTPVAANTVRGLRMVHASIPS